MAVYNEGTSAFSIIDDFVLSIGQAAAKSPKRDWDKYKVNGMLNKSSIMKASKDLVMSFPVICSDSVQPETAAMIVKAVEHNCVTTLRMLFSATYLRGDNGQEVLRMFHKNIDNDISMDDYIQVIDNLAAGGYIDNAVDIVGKTIKAREGAIFMTPRGEKMTTTVFLKEATAEVQKPKQYLADNSFSESSLSSTEVDSFGRVAINETKRNPKIKVDKKTGNYINNGIDNPKMMYIRNKQTGQFEPAIDPITGKTIYYGYGSKIPPEGWDNIDQAWEYDSDFIEIPKFDKNGKVIGGSGLFMTKNQFDIERSIANDKYKADQDEARMDWEKKKFGMQRGDQIAANRAREARDKARDEFELLKYQQAQRDARLDQFNKQLLDTDVKKCNSLVPSLIVVRYNVTDASRTNNTLVEDQFIAGVKANLYPSSTREIVEKIRDAFTNNGKLGWIKAATGEISFMKDFILGIDKAKISAKNTKLSQTSSIWSHLQYRSNKSVLNRLRRNKPNDAGAITTLCITNEEVDYLNKEYNINIMDIKTAHKLMEAYNFMQLIVVDENFEVAHFLMDGNKYWEDNAFSTLQREDKDNSYKKVVNLLGKVNRG